MSEHSLVSGSATVMHYNDQTRQWVNTGDHAGLSKLHIYMNASNGAYRIVGRRIGDHQVLLNQGFSRGLKFQQSSNTFLQWKDARRGVC